MQIKHRAMGSYQTNCFIVSNNGQQLIIDPGMDAVEWVKENVTNPVAILNTHGHFDHVWSNNALQKELDIPVFCPKADTFMLITDPYNLGMVPSSADVEVEGDEAYELAGLKVQYLHFPGHTPGCSAIMIEDAFFSGDFIFKGSIGRVDFPFSSPEAMKESIKRFLQIKEDMTVYPGHGSFTTVKEEQKFLPRWLQMI